MTTSTNLINSGGVISISRPTEIIRPFMGGVGSTIDAADELETIADIHSFVICTAVSVEDGPFLVDILNMFRPPVKFLGDEDGFGIKRSVSVYRTKSAMTRPGRVGDKDVSLLSIECLPNEEEKFMLMVDNEK